MANTSVIIDNVSSTMRDADSRRALVEDYLCTLEARFYINTLFAGPLCIIGMVGNIVSFLVLLKDRESPVASFLLQGLSLTDNFFLAFWFLHFALYNLFEHFRWSRFFHPSWVFIRVYTYPFVFVGQMAMIWITVLIAVSRYIAVCVPYKSSQLCNIQRMKLGVVLVLFASLLYNIPRYFELTVKRIERNHSFEYRMIATSLPSDSLYQLIYFDCMYIVFTFVLPLIILAVLNTRLVLAYRTIQRRRQALRGRSTTDGPDNNITLIMIIVIVVFMLCNAPARIFQMVQKYERSNSMQCWSATFIIQEATSILEVLNSSANFIVYCVFRKRFRQILMGTLCKCFAVKKPADLQQDPAKKPLTSFKTNGRLEQTCQTGETEVEL